MAGLKKQLHMKVQGKRQILWGLGPGPVVQL